MPIGKPNEDNLLGVDFKGSEREAIDGFI